MFKFKNLSKNRDYALRVFNKLPFKRTIAKSINVVNKYRLNKMKTPQNVTFFVTNRCNARCKHCFYWKSINNQVNELSADQIKRIVPTFKNQIGILLVTGGEPLLREDIYEIIESFYKINHTKKIHIATNGSMPKKLYSLCKNILENMEVELSVQISIDGDEAYHNQLRGVKIYSHAIESLRLLKTLKNENFVLTTATVLTKFNISQIEGIFKTMDGLGVAGSFQIIRDSHSILGLDKNFILDYNPQISGALPDIKEIKALLDKYYPKEHKDLKTILQRGIYSICFDVLNGRKPKLKCTAGITDAIIYPNGDVALCEVTKPFANLVDYDFNFYKLWKSRDANNAREKIRNCSCIHPCHIISSMKYDARVFID